MAHVTLIHIRCPSSAPGVASPRNRRYIARFAPGGPGAANERTPNHHALDDATGPAVPARTSATCRVVPPYTEGVESAARRRTRGGRADDRRSAPEANAALRGPRSRSRASLGGTDLRHVPGRSWRRRHQNRETG